MVIFATAMQRAATIDIGSNSVKYLVVEYDEQKIVAVQERVEITRLGEGLSTTGILAETAIQRTIRRVRQMVRDLKSQQVNPIFIVGTMALRSAKNGRDFHTQMRAAHLPPVNVLGGDEEARLGHLAVTSTLQLGSGKKSYCIFDTGGGSTEFTFGQGSTITDRFSLPVGLVPVTEKYLTADRPPRKAVMSAMDEVFESLKMLDGKQTDTLIGIGGTVTTLGATHIAIEPYDPRKIHGIKLTTQAIQTLRERIFLVNLEERKRIPGLDPKRADVIIAGVLITQVIMEKLKQPELVVSDAGLRLGVLLDRLKLNGKPFSYSTEWESIT